MDNRRGCIPKGGASSLIFQFKEFSVAHGRSPMRLGTDAVTVGVLAPMGKRILDVGCGCGVIGLMMAQRGAGEVEMVDIDPDAVGEAQVNIAASPWADRCRAYCADFLQFSTRDKFNVIVSNPPFFGQGPESPQARRAAARADSVLPPEAFMRKASELLAPGGVVCIIIPADRIATWLSAAAFAGLFPNQIAEIQTKPTAGPKRAVVCLGTQNAEGCLSRRLALNSSEYKMLTDPFYL